MQYSGAMAIQDPFWVARRARRIAQRARGIFVEFRPVKFTVFFCDQRLVTQDIVALSLGHVLGNRHYYPALYPGTLICNGLHNGPKIGIKEHPLVVSMIDNIDDLFGK